MRGVTQYKQKSIVSGLSVNKILNMDVRDFNKLGIKDLRKITGRLVSAGNKRIRRAREAGVTSPAFEYVERTGGMFSTKGKNLNQLRAEFVRAKNFLQSQTGTIKGAKKFKDDSIKFLHREGVDISSDTFDDVMRAYETIRRSDPKVAERRYKYAVFNEIESLVQKGYDNETVKAKIKEDLDNIYEKSQREQEIEGVSGFITIDDDEDGIPF